MQEQVDRNARVARRRRRLLRPDPKSVLIVVQNLPVPLDRRVWLECQSLVAAGYRVCVICPKGPGDPAHEHLDGVDIYKYSPPPATAGVLSFFYEFAYCWLRTAVLSLRCYRRHRFGVFQTCNPPDTYFLLALLYKVLGVRFVYDQHDLMPEMYYSRFGRSAGLLMTGLRAFERWTYASADHVVTTNESYAEVAMARGAKKPHEVTVVRSGPDADAMRPGPEVPQLRRGRAHLVCWLGIMGPQDGVDLALRAAHHYVHVLGRTDTHFALLGFGDALDDLRALARDLKLDDYVEFPGRVGPDAVRRYLSTADLGLVPDPKTPYADLSTHNKTLEYMAFGVPVVTFDLKETCMSAGDAAAVVADGDIEGFARAIADLLDDAKRRARMGQVGRERIVNQLSWAHQAPQYIAVFDELSTRLQQRTGAGMPARSRAARRASSRHANELGQ